MTKTAEVVPGKKEEFCPVCGNRVEDCVCCPECGHECTLNQGEMYCPVCGPVQPKTEPLNNK
ncbi:MAG TPA: hypothetical protein VNK06_06400 [Thermodesulfobacteriota bacterium]|nr:hypothetical protein [Thermodesulfobacteriota bacterium]